ncbi:MAG: VWA domain-containing protein [Myxococcaceae bacterium]
MSGLLSAWRFTLLGYQVGLAQPAYLGLVLVGAVAGFWALFGALRRRDRLGRTLQPRFVERLAPGVSTARPLAQALLYGFGLFWLAFALSQPQCGSKAELTKRRGIDVVVALDASKSMLARDVTPSRLGRAKLELTTLLDELKGDRVGIVVFAGDAFIQCPLTSDYAAAKLFLSAVNPDQMPQGGTNIGDALLLSKQVLDNADRGAKDRVVVLISDGEDLGGEVNEGVDALKEAGIKVLAVGIGSEQGEPIPLLKGDQVVGYKKDRDGNTVLTRLDRAGLAAIAEATGGELFYTARSVAMAEVVQVIDKLQKSELESRMVVRYSEGYQLFAAIGFVALVIGAFLRASRRRPA